MTGYMNKREGLIQHHLRQIAELSHRREQTSKVNRFDPLLQDLDKELLSTAKALGHAINHVYPRGYISNRDAKAIVESVTP